MNEQINIFDANADQQKNRPMAFRIRPKDFDQFIGQDEAKKRIKTLKKRTHRGLILYGPPGSGKTTLANLLGKELGLELYSFNAVLSGVSELRKLIDNLLETKKFTGKSGIIFIDEIHRFNKSQQDALLPYVEAGDFLLVGATTEYPRSTLNKALLSRSDIIELKALNTNDIKIILQNAMIDLNIAVKEEITNLIATHSNGDARKALSNLEKYLEDPNTLSDLDLLKKALLKNAQEYDLNSNRHYDVISAFIKSIRGSDVDSAILWLAVMLEGGEQPEFIARRLMISAAEDIGPHDPHALTYATNAFIATQNIGMPEVRIILSATVVYLCKAKKENFSYNAINKAMDFVKNNPTIAVPEHLKSQPNPSHPIKYMYTHDYPTVLQKFSPFDGLKFYKEND